MFCYQCEETVGGKGCDRLGVCGKTEDVANLQDLLVYVCKGISYYLVELRASGINDETSDIFIMESLFSTITNANFDREFFMQKIAEGLDIKRRLKEKVKSQNAPDCADWDGSDFDEKAKSVGLLSTIDEDLRSLRWTIIYALKGMSAYAHHSYVLGYKDEGIFAFMESALNSAASETDKGKLMDIVDRCGAMGLSVMELLDKANTSKYGTPEPTKVNIAAGIRPGILISGHDLGDLDILLKQAEGKGIDIYTHGEMLPANAYPYFKRQKHLVGNYGGSWWLQGTDFENFNGPIILTTNCLIPPKDSYKNRVYVTGVVGFQGLKRIPEKKGIKDFTEVIEYAAKCQPPKAGEQGTIDSGFAYGTLASAAPKILELVQAGKIKRFVVMAGCDGRHKDRSYYTDYAKALPGDTVILTAGCAKYRYNKLELGEIEGIPRVIDAGQCNDSYSLIKIALALKNAVGAESVNDLPLTFNIAWYEQKAALILLTLLHLGIKDITLGPRLPAFLSPNVRKQIVEKTGLRLNSNVSEDMRLHLGR